MPRTISKMSIRRQARQFLLSRRRECIGAVCAPVYICMLPNKDPRLGASLTDRAHEIDHVRAVLTLGAFVSGTMAISFGGITYPWGSGKIIDLFVCSSVLFTMLGIQQVYIIFITTSRRIFPVEFLKSRTLILFAMTSIGGTAVFLPSLILKKPLILLIIYTFFIVYNIKDFFFKLLSK